MKKIIIADDHPLFRQALRATVEPMFAAHEIHEFETLERTLNALEQSEIEQISLLFLDLRMADSQSLAGLMMVRSQYPELPVVVVSASDEPSTVRMAIQAGASGYIFKSFSLAEIKHAVETVLQGKIFTPTSISSTSATVSEVEKTGLNNIAKISSLTPAQLRVFKHMYDGLMNKQIAHEMGITEATVKAHVTTVYRKLGVRTRTQAVVMGNDLDVAESID